MRFKSPAKINLGLEVLRRRKDAFHDLSSIMLAIDVCDVVSVRSGRDARFAEPKKEFSRTGLTDQALAAYCNAVGIKAEFIAGVKKTIRTAAGLGGGSSNAAIVLWAANLLSEHAFSESELAEVAGQIGSDVPFFLSGGCALVSGRGEIRKQDLPNPKHLDRIGKSWRRSSHPGRIRGAPNGSEFTSGARTRVLAASLAAGQPRWDLLHNGLQKAAERLCRTNHGHARCAADAYPLGAAIGERRHVLRLIRRRGISSRGRERLGEMQVIGPGQAGRWRAGRLTT